MSNVSRSFRWLALMATIAMPSSAFAGEEPQLNVPPPGFRALFNGKDLTGWLEAKEAPKHWSVQDGMLVFDGKGRSLATVDRFEHFVLLVDWKVPPKGNSGIFLWGQPRLQVEINDADDPRKPIWAGTTGGLFPVQPPLKRAAKPAGEWNHFEITAEPGADGSLVYITVRLNGEITLDRYEAPGRQGRTGPLVFQNHGTLLWFRNIFIKPLP